MKALPARITRMRQGRPKTRALLLWIDSEFEDRPWVMPSRIVAKAPPEHRLQRFARLERERMEERIDRIIGVDRLQDTKDKKDLAQIKRRARKRLRR